MRRGPSKVPRSATPYQPFSPLKDLIVPAFAATLAALLVAGSLAMAVRLLVTDLPPHVQVLEPERAAPGRCSGRQPKMEDPAR